MTRNELEAEAQSYWGLSRSLRWLARAKMAFPDDVREIVDELEVLADYTNNKPLRRLCLSAAAFGALPGENVATSRS